MRTKRSKPAGRLAMPWMIRWRGRQAVCFLKVLKCGLFLAESKLVLAEPPLNGVWAEESALKELKALKVTGVDPGGVESAAGEAWRACPENMLDKRGMRAKGLPENTRIKHTLRTKVLSVRLRAMGSASGRVDQTLACLGWRPGAESGIVCCKLTRTKSSGRLAMPWMARPRERRVIWISRVLLVDTPYRCEIGQLCRVSDSYFSAPSAVAVKPRLPIPCRKMTGLSRPAALLVPARHISHGLPRVRFVSASKAHFLREPCGTSNFDL
jgi:hypothetical protein